MPVRTVVYGAGGDFDPIRPDESDVFSFDFSAVIAGVQVSSQVITCTVDPDSPEPDADPSSRLLNLPTTQGGVVSVLIGTMLNGVEYDLTCTLTLANGRVLVTEGSLECDETPLPTGTKLTPARFRQDFPEFSGAAYYPDSLIASYIGWAQDLDPNRWRNDLLLGQELFVAHMLTLERQAIINGKSGRPNLAVGPASSRSVNGVSVSYDVSVVASADAGFWNTTSYGQRYWFYLQQAGMGPLQF